MNAMKNLFSLSITLVFLGFTSGVLAQGVGIGTTTFSPTSDALLELRSTTKGFLAPRMTAAQKNAISSPTAGLMVYQTDGSSGFYYHNGASWIPFTGTDDLGNHQASEDIVMHDNLLVNVAGGPGVRIDNNGNVGIGQNTPLVKLTNSATNESDGSYDVGLNGMVWRTQQDLAYSAAIVNNPAAVSGHGLLVEAGNNSGNLGIIANFASSNSSKLVIREDGNIGMGVYSPGHKLEISGGNIQVNATGGTAYGVRFQNPAGTFTTTIRAGAQTNNYTLTLPANAPVAGNALITDGSGNLSWSSVNAWDITGNAGTTASSAAIGATVNNNFLGTKDNVALVFATNNLERLRISSDGNVGIGTNSPSRKLHVVGGDNSSSVDAATTNVLGFLENTTNNGSAVFNIQAKTATNTFASRLGINPTYNVGGVGPAVYAWYAGVNGTNKQILMYDFVNFHLNLAPSNAAINNVAIGLNQPTVGSKLTVNGNLAISNGTGSYSTTAAPAGGAIIEGNVGIGVTGPSTKFDVDGGVRLRTLSGTGSRMVVADATGNLSTQAIPAGGGSGWLLAGNTLAGADADNFVGSINNKPVNFRVNNQTSGILSSNGNAFFGYQVTIGTGSDNVGIGAGANVSGSGTSNNVAIGHDAQVQAGNNTLASIAIGHGANVTGGGAHSNSIAMGRSAQVQASNGTAIGQSANVNQQYGLAIGDAAQAQGNSGVSLGRSAYVNQTDALAVGTSAQGQGVAAISIGKSTNTNSADAIAIGSNAQGHAASAVAVGERAYANGISSVAIGGGEAGNITQASGNYTIAMGYRASTNTVNGIAIGQYARSQAANAIAIGYNSYASTSNSMILGGTGADAVNVGINISNPTQKLQVNDGNIFLSRSGGTAGELRFQGTGTGMTTFKAGAQGATNINYTLPIAAAASNGSVLVSTTAGVMSWDSFLKPTTVTASANTSNNSASYSSGSVSGMSIASVPAGTYLVTFSANITQSGSTACSCIINIGGTDASDTERNFVIPGSVSTFTMMGEITVGSTSTVEVRCQKTTGGSGFTIGKRAFSIQSTN